MSENHQNPFDNENYDFFVLKNAKGQFSLWPGFASIPIGWTTIFGPDERKHCLSYIDEHWTALT